MTRFFFHIVDGDVVDLDDQGVDLPDVKSVPHEAVVAARGLIMDDILEGTSPNTRRYFKVTDVGGNIVAVVPFSEVIKVE